MLSEGVHAFRLCIAVSLCDAGLLQLKQAFSIFIRHLKNIHAGSVDKKNPEFIYNSITALRAKHINVHCE